MRLSIYACARIIIVASLPAEVWLPDVVITRASGRDGCCFVSWVGTCSFGTVLEVLTWRR